MMSLKTVDLPYPGVTTDLETTALISSQKGYKNIMSCSGSPSDGGLVGEKIEIYF